MNKGLACGLSGEQIVLVRSEQGLPYLDFSHRSVCHLWLRLRRNLSHLHCHSILDLILRDGGSVMKT